MPLGGGLQIALYLAVLLVLAKLFGGYMGKVYQGQSSLNRLFAPVERLIYQLSGVDPEQEMRWIDYALCLLWINLFGALAVYGMQRIQDFLPLNPNNLVGVSPDSAFNTAISFATNTDWQSYSGESTMSHLTQMLALTVQNFLSAASGMAVLVAVIRGFVRDNADTLGNFWVDLTRTNLYILLPLSILFAVLLAGQGVVQTLSPYQTVAVLESSGYEHLKPNSTGKSVQQTLALGPVAEHLILTGAR